MPSKTVTKTENNSNPSFVLQRCARVLRYAICFSIFAIAGCDLASQGQGGPKEKTLGQNDGKPKIFAVSHPLAWTTAQIVGDFAVVECPAAQSEFPDRWRPDRTTLAQMQVADLVISNGSAAPYAKWLQTSSLPSERMIEAATRGLSLADFISVDDIQIVHSHGPEGEHSHPTMVSRTWLSPKVLAKQAAFIEQQLSSRYPDQATVFAENLSTLTSELDSIGGQVKTADAETVVSCLSATPEVKFLTRFAQVDDRHFNWKPETTRDQANADFEERIRELEAASENENQADRPSISVVVFPDRLKTLAQQIDATLSGSQYRPVFIDLLDREIQDRDFLSRLRANVATLAELRQSISKSDPK